MGKCEWCDFENEKLYQQDACKRCSLIRVNSTRECIKTVDELRIEKAYPQQKAIYRTGWV